MANDFKYGNKKIPNMYYGNKQVISVYFGNNLIWPTSSYVKYHMHFSWSSNGELVLYETFINGNTAATQLVDGGWYNGEWHFIEDSKISTLRAGSRTQFDWGTEVELNFIPTNENQPVTSIGFSTDPYYVGINHFLLEIIGEDQNGNKTTIISQEMTVSQNQTYTINI